MKLERKVDVTVPLSSPKQLSSVPEKRLALYGVAVGAVLAAGISEADATLITLDLTSLSTVTRTTPVNGFLYFQVNAATPATAVGFAAFSTANFRLSNYRSILQQRASINGVLPNNSIAVDPYFTRAARFTGSNSVGPANGFAHSASIGGTVLGKVSFGNFGPGDTGYLGLKFTIFSNPFYGWANITVHGDYTVTLNTLCYEDSGRPAHVPTAAAVPDQGSSILLLAMGAAGIAAFRGRQRKAA
jgi:hypothetical protein